MIGRATADGNGAQSVRDRRAPERGPDAGRSRPGCVGESSPVETFSLLANEDRLAILAALVRAHRRGETPLSFSGLRERVGIRDSGRFAYHLRELTGHLVARSPDGYTLHERSCGPLLELVESAEL